MHFVATAVLTLLFSVLITACSGGEAGDLEGEAISSETIISDEQLLFGNNGYSDYLLSAESNSTIATLNAKDPELNLRVGKRYEVAVTNYLEHPFEIIDAGGNPLLSMGSNDGAYESDSGINFIDNGAGKIAFTFTRELADVAVQYRCAVHRLTMVGAIKSI